MQHGSHPHIVGRLKQVRGQIDSILAMFADGRSCLDLAQQLQSVESIVHAAKRTLIQDHMEHCIGDAVSDGAMEPEQAMREFKSLAKYL
jgi:hypothetical protein NreA